MENVYVFLIKIILTPAGSFISKVKDTVEEDDDTATQKKLYYIAEKIDTTTTKDLSSTIFITEINKNGSLKVNENIYLSFLKNKEQSALTKTILDAIFKKQEQIIINEQAYDFKIELDYNKILKDKILTKLQEETKSLYKKNSYKEAFPDGKEEEFFKELVKDIEKYINDLNERKTNNTIFKNNIDITNEVERVIKLYYIEKDKNIQQREKKIYIKIKITQDNFKVVESKSFSDEGAPTFSDITKFQKELQEQISKFIQNCQNPKDIQENIKKECQSVCKSSNSDTKNQLWCSICTNYIQCVYDKDYTGKSDSADSAEIAPDATAAVEKAAKKFTGLLNKQPPVKVNAGGAINKNAKKRTISKHKLLKPQFFNKSVKVIINQ